MLCCVHRSMTHNEAFLIRDWLLANSIQAFIRTDPPVTQGEIGVWVLESDAKAAEALFYKSDDARIRAVSRIPWYHQHDAMYTPPSLPKESPNK
jgi:hypothetical protein